ncbi:hypothetical protein SUDANB95_06689 [Actinosynnema sp. ALI-1.44]
MLLDDKGMTTAEYAIGTLAAAGLATLLLVILKGDWVMGLLQGLLHKAFTAGA